jgi:glycosyltransferase involved in cell wall biosynthesis
MTKVLHLFPVHELGGAENVILNLIRYQQHPEIKHFAVLLAGEDGALGDALSALNVPWKRIPRGRMRQLWALGQTCLSVRAHVRKTAPDVILTNSPQGFAYAKLATLGLGIPIALYYMTVPRKRLHQNHPLDLLVWTLRPEMVFAASHAIRTTVEGWGMHRVMTVYHGTPEHAVQGSEKALVACQLEEIGIPPTSPLVLLPGRLQRWKGHELLVDAFPEVLDGVPSAQAVCLGDAMFGFEPDYPKELAARIEGKGLGSRVHLIGHSPIGPWLERASVVVHASLTPDAFPNVCIEALAARRPLITNRLSGTAEILTDGKDALIIEPGDAHALADAIRTVLMDEKLRNNMAEAGYRRYHETCTPAHMVERIEAGLLTLKAGAGRRR